MQSSRIRAEVLLDSHVMVPRGKKTVKIEAVALIHNDGEEHYVLGAPDSASTHGWQILDANGREVARDKAGKAKMPRGATSSHASSLVPSQLSVRESETITVDASKLKHGARYTVRHDHWGYVGEAEFVAVHEPERAAAPKKKAAKKAKRKPAKRKAAAKAKPKKAKKKAAPKKKAARKAKPKSVKKKAAKKRKVTRKKTSRKR